MTELPRVLFKECNIGQYLLAPNLCSAYEIVRSGDVMDSFVPDAGVMRCYWTSRKHQDKCLFRPGQITIDYFETEFYGPFEKAIMDHMIKAMENQ